MFIRQAHLYCEGALFSVGRTKVKTSTVLYMNMDELV